MNKVIVEQAKCVIDETLPSISNISNLLAILFHEFENINWAGLYFCDESKKECTLGPFQGKVACTRIPYGHGVVGTCAKSKQMIVVDDVHQFPGHIACDSASNSEIVIPLIKDQVLCAILDIDSNVFSNFNKGKVETIQEVAYLLSSFVSKESM